MNFLWKIEPLAFRYFVVSMFYLILILVVAMVFLMALFIFVNFPFVLWILIPIILAIYIAHIQIVFHEPRGFIY